MRTATGWMAGAVVIALAQVVTPARAFTQSGLGLAFGNGIPMGHEWLTRLSALEVLGNDPVISPDPQDPRRGWRQGRAKNTSLAGAENEVKRLQAMPWPDQRYQSTYKAVFDAIIGERWVDIAGFNVLKSMVGTVNCWDAVAQEASEAQYDHFMRRYDDSGPQGAVHAARESKARFIEYFVAAAMAPPTQMIVWDGGAISEQVKVDRNYFLFGRAVHLFQDSFSTEHTVRIADDNYTTIREVKSYLCAEGSEQHSHEIGKILNYTSGDVVWLPGTQFSSGWSSYKPSNMKTPALVATEASKDLWAAFIRTMAVPRERRAEVARREAQTLSDNWLAFDERVMSQWYNNDSHRDSTYVLQPGQSGPGQSQAQCMKNLKYTSQNEAVEKFKREQKLCLFNVRPSPGYSDLYDPSVHMPYNWQWLSDISWKEPPAQWQIPDRPADTGRRLGLANIDGLPLGAPDGLVNNAWIYVRPHQKMVPFIAVESPDGGSWFRSVEDPALFLSYTWNTGSVKLYNSPTDASFKIVPLKGNLYGLKNIRWNQWMWLNQQSPYVNRKGDPAQPNAQWRLLEP